MQPVSSWVQPAEWTEAPEVSTNSLQSINLRYLLHERQHNPQEGEKFTRVVVHLQNEAGVQDSGKLTVEFDPAYQTLIFHQIQVHRSGQILNKLDLSSIKLIQQESNLDQHLFTGIRQAVVFLEDLRVGDTLEYTYTLRGKHPLFENNYSSSFTVQSGATTDRQRFRILWPENKLLFIRYHLISATPQQTVGNGTIDYVWDFGPMPAIHIEDSLPATYEPYPYIEISDFADWKSVAAWTSPLYATENTALPPELKVLIAQWNSSASSPEEKALLALDFVQTQIRYTGFEAGVNAFQPAHPFETFRLRYGDCKGKSALLCVILQEMGIHASPALVHTQLKKRVEELLPSPFVFDHVIVKLILDGRAVWVDPTRSHQGGTIYTRYLPNYGRALVVSDKTGGLEKISWIDPESSQNMLSIFHLDNYDDPAILHISTTFRGWEADSFRAQIARNGVSKLTEQYLNYYTRRYPGIISAKPAHIEDNRRDNILKITEEYSIPKLWTRNEKSSCWETTFLAENLDNILARPVTSLRKMPLEVSYPLNRKQTIQVFMPDSEWDLPPVNLAVQDPAFTFSYHRRFTEKTLTFEYDLQTHASEVAAENVSDYLKNREEMQNAIFCSLYRNDPPPADKTSVDKPDKDSFVLNWLMAVVAVFGAIATVTGCIWVWRSGRENPHRPEHPLIPQNIGGWLILVGIGLCLAPIVKLAQIPQCLNGWFSAHIWQAAALPSGSIYSPFFGPLLIFEVLSNIATLGLTGLSIALFFAKRREFPKIYIVLLLSQLIITIIDELGCAQIPSIARELDIKLLVKVIQSALIWCPYMLCSRRVKSTFIR